MPCTISLCVTRLLGLPLALAALLASTVTTAHATDQASTIKILSSQIAPNELPEPGIPLVVKARLANTRSLKSAVRAVVVRDGRLAEVPNLKAYLNEKDLPTYEFQVAAPLVELSYRFVAYQDGQFIAASPQYVVRRQCLPSLELTDPKIESEGPREQLRETFLKASALAEEIEGYEHARLELEELQKLLNQ